MVARIKKGMNNVSTMSHNEYKDVLLNNNRIESHVKTIK